MRLNILCLSWATISLVLGSGVLGDNLVERRQDNSIPPSNSAPASASASVSASAAASGFPTLGSGNTQSAVTTAPSESGTNTQSGQHGTNSPSATASASRSGSGPGGISVSQSTNNTSTALPSITSTFITSSMPSATSDAAASDNDNGTPLPLQPHITPALSIGGVVLLLTGIVYTLIGVKNRWVHIFLSTAYLTSLSITVLIVYVLNPPVSNAIQGAYFVGIFMTGIIFGAGALVFKEVTEGLGCLLGGFCLSMWFLTLKEGGLVTSTGGKAIFISAFCVVAWSLSFSHYTRAYGLIFSISFSGATAFVLGIDCFSRGGLKEFWLYIWHLNDNIFPLNTNTYPISRGTRVETIVIVLACIIGIISQLKLWKIVKDRQKQRDAAETEDSRRREVVEAALGRHLERQNDRDRSQWEKQYGDRLTAKRETVLWTDAHGEKRYSKIKETELPGDQHTSSSESLEMTNIPRQSRSMYVTRIKRASMPVTSIPEAEEAEGSATNKAQVRQHVLDQLEGNNSNGDQMSESNFGLHQSDDVQDQQNANEFSVPGSTVDGSYNRISSSTQGKNETEHQHTADPHQDLSIPQEGNEAKKKRTFASLLSRSKEEKKHRDAFHSQEALIVPERVLRHSRASSLAATLDFENEHLELPPIETDVADPRQPPEVEASPVEQKLHSNLAPAKTTIQDEPELSEEHFDVDPEEFVRKAKSEAGTEESDDEIPRPKTAASQTSQNEVLTKDALESMPTQLSHVVMSYRTNEWAKHISTAEAPIFEEPEPVEDGDKFEVPTHLADPISADESKRSSLSQPLPPEVPVPVPSALPSVAQGIRVNPAIRPEQATISAVVQPPQPVRAKSGSDGRRTPRGLRSTSSPMLVQQALQKGSAEETTAANVVRKPKKMRSASPQLLNNPIPQASPNPNRSSTVLSHYPPVHRSNSRLSMVSEHGIMPPRPDSQMSSYQQLGAFQPGVYPSSPYQGGSNQPVPARSDTRLQFYDSHQPLKRNLSMEGQKREMMMADWRVSQNKTPDLHSQAEMHRQQMLMDRHQAKVMEEQEKNYRSQQEIAVDAMMRSKDMQELHREAMRKMQAGANKKLG